jgi:hypothetical protein
MVCALVGPKRLDPWVIAAIVVGVALRFINLGAAALWFDETFSYYHSVTPWPDFLRVVVEDNQAPIYYTILKAWSEVAGLSPWAMRVPGLVASAACIPLMAAVARVAAGERAARATAWLAALSPYLIQHAQDARPYALLSTFATIDLLLLVRFVTGHSARLGVLWVLFAVAVVATHYYGIFFLAGEGLALLLLHPKPFRSWLPAGVVAGGLCGAIVLLAARAANGTFAGEYVFGVTAMPGVVWSLLTGYTLMPTSEQLHALGPKAILPDLPIALLALPAFAVVALAGIRLVSRPAGVALLSAFGVALLAPFFYRLAAGAGVHPRYFAAAIAPVLVLTAVGMAPDRLSSPRGISTIALGLVMMLATFLHLRDTGHGREDVYAAGRWLDANVPVDEEILITSIEMEHLAHFHWPKRHFRRYPVDHHAVKPSLIPSIVDGLPFGDHDHAYYLIGRAWISDPDGELQHALVQRYPACPGVEVAGIRILCLRRTNAAVAHGGS